MIVRMKAWSEIVALLSVLVVVFIPQTEGQVAVMSIDLGSEYMKIAIVKAGVPMEIVLNKESRRKTPVIVAMRDDDRSFSDGALTMGVRYPKNAYWHLQDLLGKKFSNPLVHEYQKKFPYYELEEDPETGTVLFKHTDTIKYSPEELLAMVLEYAKQTAEEYAEQKINEAVITVPPFFNQAERRSLLRAANYSGIRILQLINDNTAVALNYGVFRRKAFNTSVVHYMFFDMGASATTATIVAYQVVKAKNADTGLQDTFPQLTIKGVGYDRTLGGLNMNLRMQKHFAILFNAAKKTSTDVKTNPRAMAKLLKEADRVKRVLSANSDHIAQVEGLLDDQDMKVKVTRDQLEELCADMGERIKTVVNDALKMSEVTMDEIKEVILMGGGTRMPKVQEMLRKAIGRDELGKGINTDEAAAMGAAYQAAHLSKGFKVKKFNIKDANLFPIQVEFQRTKPDSTESRTVKRTLFGRLNPYPQKKVMTFNKHTHDFSFDVNYGDLQSFMSESDIGAFDATKLHEVSLQGVEEANTKHSQDTEAKGVKAHFRMDESGLLNLDKVESVFEKTVADEAEADQSNIQSTLSKLGSKLSSLFGSSADEKPADSASTDTDKDETQQNLKKEDSAEEKVEQNETEAMDDTKEPLRGSSQGTPLEPLSETPQMSPPETPQKNSQEASQVPHQEAPKEGAHEAPVKPEATIPQEHTEEDHQKETASDESQTTQQEETTTSAPTTNEDEKKDEDKKDVKDEKSSEKKVTDEKPVEEKQDTNTTDESTDKETETKPEEKKEAKKKKQVVVKEDIKSSTVVLDMKEPSDDMMKASRKRIRKLRRRDEERALRERVQNELESFIVDTQDKLYQEIYEKSSTETEREEIRAKLSEASDWLYEQALDTEVKVYEDKLSELKTLTNDLYMRVKEAEERPRALEALKSMLNYTQHFIVSLKNFTGEDQPFTLVEFETISKLMNETQKWKNTMEKEQSKLAAYEAPKLTVEDIAKKISELDREVKYLLNKARTFKPKVKRPAENETESDNSTKPLNETKKEEEEPKAMDEEKKAVVEDEDEASVEVEDSTIEVTEATSTDSETDSPKQKAADEL